MQLVQSAVPLGDTAEFAAVLIDNRRLLAIMFVSLPPLGIIGWLSPIHVASALYPGSQLAGLLLLS